MAEREPLPPPVRDHLERLTGRHGIYQHARGPRPDRRHGTCTDDVARALVVDVMQATELGWPAIRSSAERSVTYLEEAFDPVTARFRNMRADDGAWLDRPGSQDSHGRAMVGLATAMALEERPGDAGSAALAGRAAALLERAVPASTGLIASRAVASSILACCQALGPGCSTLSAMGRRRAEAALDVLARRLGAAFASASRRPTRPRGGAWPWPEPAVTYEAFLLPRALLAAGDLLLRDDLLRLGGEAMDWLLDRLVDQDNRFHPVGNRGWWQHVGPPARFDQQPIEAGSLVAAADLAHRLTGDARYLDAAEAGYGWFIGRNDLGVAVALAMVGACQDGLGPDRVNDNQGAESTLAWLATVEHLRAIRARADRKGDQRSGSTKPWGSGRGHDRTYSRTAS
jgi:hypothetical protein